MSFASVRALLAAVAVALLLMSGAASAQEIDPDFAAPVVILDRAEARQGERMFLTIAGFRSPVVTAAICGNDARRGSGDCDTTGSKTIELLRDGSSTVSEFLVALPPEPCPCVVRVASSDNSEVAVADITLANHPTGPVVGSDLSLANPISVSLAVERAPRGFLGWFRSSMGGGTDYDTIITVRNRTTEPVDTTNLRIWAQRGTRVLTELDIAPPSVEAGAVAQEVQRIRLPAPVYGSADWLVNAGTATSPTVVAAHTTSHLPGLLLVVLALLVADLGILVFRFLKRRRNGDAGEHKPSSGSIGETTIDLTGPSPVVVRDGQPLPSA